MSDDMREREWDDTDEAECVRVTTELYELLQTTTPMLFIVAVATVIGGEFARLEQQMPFGPEYPPMPTSAQVGQKVAEVMGRAQAATRRAMRH